MIEMMTFASREEWLKNRMNGIGGSEISAVVGQNPYMTNVELWELKTGRRTAEDISDKPYVKYGQQAERHIRGLFRLDNPQYDVKYVDNNSWQNSRYPWALASLDGWMNDAAGRMGILEIKTTEIQNPAQWVNWKNQIPQNYFCQCLFYMAILNADFCILTAQIKYTDKDGNIVKTVRQYPMTRKEHEADIEYLMEKGAEFWEYVKADKRPPLILPGI